MTRVFLSRYQPGLKAGDGASINWRIGETVVIIGGRDEGRRMVITSEGRSHDEAPAGELVREGYFADDPHQTLFAKMERYLWFDNAASAEREAGMKSLELK